ncbi:MAG: cardiolipin synthase ClsB [Lautropia sp.]
MSTRWIPGNTFELLENGEAFFPRAFAAIGAAREQVLVETFILFDDKVGRALKTALLDAAGRGVTVDLTIDGWGSAYLPAGFVGELTAGGVRVHVFDPGRTILNWRTNMFRRMHRKILVIDHRLAFIGGINYAADHLADFGPEAKQDYAVAIEGPLVTAIDRFARETLRRPAPRRGWLRSLHAEVLAQALVDSGRGPRRRQPRTGAVDAGRPADAGHATDGGLAMLVTRDNRSHRNDIEQHYRTAMRLARRRIVIANAYFFPGYRLLQDLRRAARRGVDVRLILQGEPDMPIVKSAASLLYHHLTRAGVRIYEYCERPLHGKVAIVDDEWATVGSSNLDPLSLSLNLEANVMIRDRGFNRELSQRLERLMRERCRRIEASELQESNLWRVVRSFFVFHFLRHFPSWAGWLPRHAPKLQPADDGEPS